MPYQVVSPLSQTKWMSQEISAEVPENTPELLGAKMDCPALALSVNPVLVAEQLVLMSMISWLAMGVAGNVTVEPSMVRYKVDWLVELGIVTVPVLVPPMVMLPPPLL